VEVVKASFPSHQQISRRETLELVVRNRSSRPLPQVAVAIRSFTYRSTYPHLADPNRPTWIVDEGPGPKPPLPVEMVSLDSPGGAVTDERAQWALGPLGPGQERVFSWQLTPVRSGPQRLGYVVVAARLHSSGPLPIGQPVAGTFPVQIAPAPLPRYVNPATGAVELGKPAVQPGP